MMNPEAARMRVKVVLKNGEIIRPTTCEVCGSTLEDREEENGLYAWRNVRTFLVAHHWRGYDYPLDVWWVCSSCNRKLIKHDGSVTLEQARELVKPFGGWFAHEIERRKSRNA